MSTARDVVQLQAPAESFGRWQWVILSFSPKKVTLYVCQPLFKKNMGSIRIKFDKKNHDLKQNVNAKWQQEGSQMIFEGKHMAAKGLPM